MSPSRGRFAAVIQATRRHDSNTVTEWQGSVLQLNHPFVSREQATRHQYYLQLRKDVLENNIRIHDDTAMVLASYALQAELGDYEKSSFGTDYFVPQHYLPAKVCAKSGILLLVCSI